MRSKLFVPASRPELFSKALASEADALCFDLEDAVAESRKAEGRENLRVFLRSPAAMASAKTFIVRVNSLDSTHFEDDLCAVLVKRLDLLNLPKPASVDHVWRTASAMEKIETKNGVTEPIGILLNIETPAAFMDAPALATAHPRVAGLQLGLADLFEPLAISRESAAAVQMAMFWIRMAAGSGNVFACDAAFANIADTDGFVEEARRARELGFIGKSCIHPSQVALANEIFRPTEAEVAHAARVVAAAGQRAADGIGAFRLDGKMIDEPFVRRARAIVAEASRLGVPPADTS